MPNLNKDVRVPKFKEKLSLSKIETKLRCSLSLSKWQENELRKFSAEKLKEKGLVWVLKRSIQAQKVDAQASGAMMPKEKRRKLKNNCQARGLRQIIKIIGHCIIYSFHPCLCHGIHPLVCLVISQLLILVLGMDLYIMKGWQIVLPIDDFLFEELKYFILAMHAFVVGLIWLILCYCL